MQPSNDDQIIDQSSFQPYELNPGQTSNVLSRSYIIPSNNTFNGMKYLLIVIDPFDNFDESDETNNVFAFQVQISTPIGPTACVETIGPGDILCTERDGNNLTVYLENNLIVSKFTLNGQGEVIAAQNGGSLIMDSILVQGNQVVKKLSSGAIVYSKTIPQSVLDSIPVVQAAAELTDGTLVLTGYRKKPVTNPPTSPARNFLVLVNTDANLNPLQFQTKEVSNVFNPYHNFSDFVLGIYTAPNAAFDIFYSSTISTLITYQSIYLNRFSFNDPQGFSQVGQLVGSQLSSNTVKVTKTHCNTYRYTGPTGHVGQKGHFFGVAVSHYDMARLVPHFKQGGRLGQH